MCLGTDISVVLVNFVQLEYDEPPVVNADSKKVMGLLRRRHLLVACSARLTDMQADKA